MAERKKLEIKMTDTDEIQFKAAVWAYFTQVSDDNIVVENRDLAIHAHGTSLKEASIEFKDKFCELASDLFYKSQYMPLSGKERRKLDIVRSVCTVK